ncbi:MAG: sigma 54-interacting transcriptional regulator [Planctomycetaceae bacterium]|nr:sigma 54-interacting transcriptional regulator [Planctomycetaceae bacterium]
MPRRGRRPSGSDSWLKETSSPVFLVDDLRRLRFFNQGCEELTGWKSDDLTGRECEYVTGADPAEPESLLGSLAPPPQVLEGQQLAVPAYIPHRTQSPAARTILFLPLLNESGGVDSVLGLIVEIPPPAGFGRSGLSAQLHAELAALRNSLRRKYRVENVIARESAMLRVMEQVRLAAAQPVSVCLQGETGTGREHLARAIHYHSQRSSLAFVPLDCAALGASEIKQTVRRILQELSGGTGRNQPGGPPILQPGTLYLKSVESLSRDVQQMLLDALPDWNTPEDARQPALRLMASTTEVWTELCRQDLLLEPFAERFSVLPVMLPPLRSRTGDFDALTQFFLEEGNRGAARQISGISSAAWRQLREYAWPGNLDELQAVLSEARTLCDGHEIDVPHLPFRFRTGMDAQQTPPVPRPPVIPLADKLTQVEREHILAALESVRFNRSRAARLLGLTRARLYRRMDALGLSDLATDAEER